jgi:hypothetical protein
MPAGEIMNENWVADQIQSDIEIFRRQSLKAGYTELQIAEAIQAIHTELHVANNIPIKKETARSMIRYGIYSGGIKVDYFIATLPIVLYVVLVAIGSLIFLF